MKIIKLNAIDSTNSFLKDLAQQTPTESFTVVTADYQKKGKGQLGSEWFSEPYKNLICSVYISFKGFSIDKKVLLNYAVSVAVFNVLQGYNIPKLAIKWPNDILSLNKKICGLLIESVMKEGEIKSSVIGIGLNVNQTSFSETLKNVSSMKNQLKNEDIDLDILLQKILSELKIQIGFIENSKANALEETYLDVLYKKNIPSMFKNDRDVLFIGKIIGVSSIGKIQIELDDDSVKEFGIKEVSFA